MRWSRRVRLGHTYAPQQWTREAIWPCRPQHAVCDRPSPKPSYERHRSASYRTSHNLVRNVALADAVAVCLVRLAQCIPIFLAAPNATLYIVMLPHSRSQDNNHTSTTQPPKTPWINTLHRHPTLTPNTATLHWGVVTRYTWPLPACSLRATSTLVSVVGNFQVGTRLSKSSSSSSNVRPLISGVKKKLRNQIIPPAAA
jgi:hypothetical protein